MSHAARSDLPDEAPHVLVVDDDRRLRELLARYLTDQGFRVTAAASAAGAGPGPERRVRRHGARRDDARRERL